MRALIRTFRSLVREHAPLIALLLAAVAVGLLVEIALGLRGMARGLAYRPSFRYFLIFMPIPPVFAFLFLRLGVRGEDGRWLSGRAGWRRTWHLFRERYLRMDRVVGALLAGLSVAVTINLYGLWKLRIPTIQPFSWDERLAALDRVIHLGRQPWEWLQPMLGHPLVTTSLDLVYYTWLPLVGFVCAWQAWSHKRENRLRFFLTFSLIWLVLGVVVATALSSAGPCYWDELGLAPNPYTALFAYHELVASQVPFGTAHVQEALWARYLGTAPPNPYMGIAAMPSIHVSMPLLYCLAAGGLRRWPGRLFALYGLLILVGSVHLGWHYAIDGYLSLLLVPILWAASGWVVRRTRPARTGEAR